MVLPIRKGSVTRDFARIGRTAMRSGKTVRSFTKSVGKVQRDYHEGYLPVKYATAKAELALATRKVPSRSMYEFSTKRVNLPKANLPAPRPRYLGSPEPDFDKLVPMRYQGRERYNAVENMRMGWRQAVRRDKKLGRYA